MSGDRYRRVDGSEYVEWWLERYATDPGRLREHGFWQKGRNSVWVAAAEVDPGSLRPVDGVGIPFVRLSSRMWKPTGVAAVHFGSSARRHVVDLEADEAARFLDRREVRFASGDDRRELPWRGFVIVRWGGVAIGICQWRGDHIESMVSKGRRLAAVDLPRAR